MKKHDVNLDQVKQWIEQAKLSWLNDHLSEDTVRKKVRALLDKNVQLIIMKLLGFDVRYGREWEIDHCNSRSGNSAAGDFLRSQAGAAVNEWLNDQAGNLKNMKLPQSATESLLKDYHAKVQASVKRQLEELAQAHAAELVTQMLADQGIDEKVENVTEETSVGHLTLSK